MPVSGGASFKKVVSPEDEAAIDANRLVYETAKANFKASVVKALDTASIWEVAKAAKVSYSTVRLWKSQSVDKEQP